MTTMSEKTARKIQQRYYAHEVRYALAEMLFRELYDFTPTISAKSLYKRLLRAGFEWNGTYWTTEKVESPEPVEGQ